MKPSLPFEEVFPEVVGNEEAKLALVLNLIDPKCGGVLIVGERGTGKSLLLQAFKRCLETLGVPWVEVPLNVTEEQLLGALDIEESIKRGQRVFNPPLLQRAKGGFVLVDDIGLFDEGRQGLLFSLQTGVFVAALNPSEGQIPLHFLDRFGMCVLSETLGEPPERKAILEVGFEGTIRSSEGLKERFKAIRSSVPQISYGEEVLEGISRLCATSGARSNRAEVFMFYAARALAALEGSGSLSEEHLRKVASLVLRHRARMPEEDEREWEFSPSEGRGQKGGSPCPEKGSNGGEGQASPFDPGENTASKPKAGREEVFEIASPLEVKGLTFKRDRLVRKTWGRRTRSKSSAKGGRSVRSVLWTPDQEIDLFGTLKAAAPFQTLRRSDGKMVVKEEDLRFKEKERKISHLFVFVVDGSGSMGVERRMAAAKGAIFSLLMDCYKKRDKVAMILFRKTHAELVLPPTSSVELAHKRLRELPTGGRTPLGHGLLEAYRLIGRQRLRDPKLRVVLVLVTDGRANVPIIQGSDPLREVKTLCLEISQLPLVDSVVVDSEPKGSFRMGLARELARWTGGYYVRLEDMRVAPFIGIEV